VCDPALVETVRAIKRDCKPCPKCGAMIHRIAGCNQMFCTAPSCNTPFDWSTLKIIDAALAHNPHLFEYRRRLALQRGEEGGGGQGSQQPPVEEIACFPGGPPTVHALANALATWPVRGRAGSADVREQEHAVRREVDVLLRFVTHVDAVLMRNTFRAAPDVIDPAANEDLRKRFLKNEIDEARLSVLLQAREKARRKRDAFHQILRTFVDVVGDLLLAIVRRSHGAPERSGSTGDASARSQTQSQSQTRHEAVKEACEQAVAQASDVAEYVNAELGQVAKRYHCKAPRIARRILQYHGGVSECEWSVEMAE
jgi:hypothetical protein